MRLFFLFLALPILTYAQTKEFEREYSYQLSEDDSRNSAREKATREAQALLLQELGILLESRQQLITKQSGYEASVDYQQEINVYTLGKVETKIIQGTEKFDGHTYSARFTMVVDTVALYEYLDDIVKQKQQARVDSLAQIRKARADSLEKARKISDIELAVRTAKNSLEEEQRLETPLRIERNKKEKELRLVETEKNNAQDALDRALNTRPLNMVRIENERKIYEEAERNYNNALAEYNPVNSKWNEANNRVQAARRNLQAAEDNLAREMGIEPQRQPQTRQGTQQRHQTQAVKKSGKRRIINTDLYEHSRNERSIITIGVGLMIGGVWLDNNKIFREIYNEDGSFEGSFITSIGLIAGIAFTNRLASYSEFYYTSKGFGDLTDSKCSSSPAEMGKYCIEESALEIPLLIKWDFYGGNYTNDYNGLTPFLFYIEAGVLFGIPLETTVNIPDYYSGGYFSETYTSREKRDFGYIFGTGLNIGRILSFGLRVNVNTTNFSKDIKGSFWSLGFIMRAGLL
jgi:hypothetical protein